MNVDDETFVRTCHEDGLVLGSVLELGGGYGGETCKGLMKQYGLDYYCTDLPGAPAPVDFSANFESGAGIAEISSQKLFNCILVLNVLEHVFHPIKVLDSARGLLQDGGVLITATPAVWPIHNYPVDCNRLLPDWYRSYTTYSGMRLLTTHFVYLGCGRVDTYRTAGVDHFPKPWDRNGGTGLWSRIVHRLLDTYGRGMQFKSHISIGAVFKKEPADR